MQIAYVHALLAVIQTGAFAAAAPLVHLATGSAVSKQVKKLEQHYGTSLLVKQDGFVVPTPAGEQILRHMKAIVDADTAAMATLAILAGQPVNRSTVHAPQGRSRPSP